MKTKTRSLFGGALFSAGMAVNAMTTPVQADQPLPFLAGGYNAAYAGFFAYPFGSDYSYGSDFQGALGGPTAPAGVNWSDFWGSASASAAVTEKAIMASASWSYDYTVGYAWSSAWAGAYLAPDVSTTLQLSWSYSGYGAASVIIYDSDFLPLFASETPSGEATFKMEGGETYLAVAATNLVKYVESGVGGLAEASGEAHISVVPAPGAMALLGAAGLCGLRRRRRD